MQLLMNQAPISVVMMLYVIPFADDVTVWRDVGGGVYGLIGVVSSSFRFGFGEDEADFVDRADFWLV